MEALPRENGFISFSSMFFFCYWCALLMTNWSNKYRERNSYVSTGCGASDVTGVAGRNLMTCNICSDLQEERKPLQQQKWFSAGVDCLGEAVGSWSLAGFLRTR